MTQQCLPKKP